jgi:hypothetical protein
MAGYLRCGMGQTQKSGRPPGRAVLAPEADIARLHAQVLSLSETHFGWQVKPNRAMFLSYERSLQLHLVGAGIMVPIAGLVGGRDPGPSASD